MTLDIIAPHYKEPWETCKFLFESLALQRAIPWENVKVIVVNDGDDTSLDEVDFGKYPYRVEYMKKPHGGVSAARNYGLDHSTADYVMFCDIDDGFLNNYGLHMVFSAMQDEFDFLISNFVEETYTAEKPVKVIMPHDQDLTFMHGKVYRREFLVSNELRFDERLTIHEDGYFNMIVNVEAENKGKVKKITTPFYLWCWNDNSTVRRNKEDFVLKTYDHVMRVRAATCNELKRRGYEKEYELAVGMTVLNSYYDFQKTSYRAAKNQRYMRMAEKEFKAYWEEFKKTFYGLTNMQISDIAKVARANAVNNGMMMEQDDLRTFLKQIERIKP